MNHSGYVSRLRFFSAAMGVSALALSSAALLWGWLDLPVLKSAQPGLTALRMHALLSLMLMGVALTILRMARSNARDLVVRGIGVFVALTSFLLFFERAAGGDFSILHLLCREVSGAGPGSHLGQVCPIEALIFLFSGFSLVLLNRDEKWAVLVSQGMLLVAGACSLAIVLDYVYVEWAFVGFGGRMLLPAVSLPAALGCLLICIGALCARPDHGVMTVLTSEGPGGTMARWLMPILLLLPIALDLTGIGLQRIVHLGGEAGSMISALLMVVLSLSFVYSISRSLDWKDSERRRAQKAIEVSEARYQQIIEGIQEGFVVMDLAGRILRINPRMGTMLGRAPSELVGTSIFSVVDEAGRDVALNAICRREQKPGERYEMRLLHKNGSSVFAWISSSRIQDEEGGFISVVWLVEDVTAQQLARVALIESEARFRAVAETASDAIVSADATGRIVLWNRAAQRVFGYTEAEIIGRLTTLLIPEEAAQAHKEAFQQLVCSDGVVSRGVVELTGRRKDGTEFPGEVSIALHKTENGTFVTAIIRDVSERKKAESEREMLLASLEHVLKEVKTLSGIIPICAGCKKIRNDKGFWDQVETYISNHSEAHFSHGLCPDCIRKYYPEFAQDQRTDDALKHGS